MKEINRGDNLKVMVKIPNNRNSLIKHCTKCGTELNDDNIYPSMKKKSNYKCIFCTHISAPNYIRRKGQWHRCCDCWLSWPDDECEISCGKDLMCGDICKFYEQNIQCPYFQKCEEFLDREEEGNASARSMFSSDESYKDWDGGASNG